MPVPAIKPGGNLSQTESVLAEALEAFESKGVDPEDSDSEDSEVAAPAGPPPKRKVRLWLPVVGVLLAGAAFYAGPRVFKAPPEPAELNDIRLVVSSNPPSDVYRGEELIGPTPQTVIRMEQGEVLRLVKEGYVTQSVGFHSARPEKVGRVIMNLSFLGIPLDWAGLPEGAEIVWDGKPQPLTLLKEASPGEHLVKVILAEGPPVLFKFSLDPPQGAEKQEPYMIGQQVVDQIGRRRTVAMQLTLPGFSVPEPAEVPEPSPSPEPAVSPTPGATPADTASPAPEASPQPAASPQPSATPKPVASPKPVATPKPKPAVTPKPTTTPMAGATPAVSASPTPAPEPEVPDITVALLVEEITEEHEPYSASVSVGTRTRTNVLLPREGRYRVTFAGSDEYGERSEEIEVKENGMVVLFTLQEGTASPTPTPSASLTPGSSPTPSASQTPAVQPIPGTTPAPGVSPTPSVTASPAIEPPKTEPGPAPNSKPTPSVSSSPVPKPRSTPKSKPSPAPTAS